MPFYANKKLFITGGSSGIGKAAALQAVKQGASVWIAARRQSVLDKAVLELEAARVSPEQKIGALSLDISDRTAVRAAVPKVLEGLGGLDVLINNAGIAHVGHVHDEPDDVYEKVMSINYFGALWVTRAFLPHFMEQRSGHINFVSSVLGLMGLYGYSAYAASKHAMNGYADCLRQDLLAYGVHVSVLYPPDTDTPQHAAELEIMPGETKALAGTITCLPADYVATALLDGIAAGQYQILPGFDNKLTMWAVQHFPWLARWVIDRDLRKYWRKNGEPWQASAAASK